jgi:cell wall-associated NlpC family hydrolase
MLKQIPVLLFIFLASLLGRAQHAELPPIELRQISGTPAVNRTELVAFAKQFLGIAYRRGSKDPEKGFDCSGFVYYVYKHFKVILPRSSKEYKSLGRSLKPEEFKVGDVLVFYGYKDKTHIGHVGIICDADGMKSRFIHASSGKAHGITISDLGSKGYSRRFYKCIDVLE